MITKDLQMLSLQPIAFLIDRKEIETYSSRAHRPDFYISPFIITIIVHYQWVQLTLIQFRILDSCFMHMYIAVN